MKESAQIALSYVRANARELGIDQSVFEDHSFHVHVPAGAVPKDGPSAGVTMFTAVASLLLGCPVKKEVAMTGEITLRGNVLPVGGIKEKILAAHRAGCKVVLIPYRNERDLDEIPKDILADLQIHLIKRVDEILPLVLEPPVPTPTETPSMPPPGDSEAALP
jgi:ATP-dependent Lon protease